MSVDSRDIGRSTALSALGNLALPLSTFLSAPLLARSLGADGRGELAAATAPLMLVLTLATFGLPEALTYTTARMAKLIRRSSRNVALLLVFAASVVTVLTILLAPVLAAGNGTVERLIQLTALVVVPSVLLAIPRSLASGLRRWGLVNLEKGLTGGLRLGATAGLFALDALSLEAAAIIIAVAPLIGGLAYIRLLVELARAPRTTGNPEESAVSLARYGLRMWLGSVSGILLSRVSQLLMLPLAGPAALGYFAVAMNVSDASLLLNNAIRDVTMSADAADRKTARLTATARLSLLLSLVGGCLIVASLPLWFTLVFGAEFNEAIVPTIILIMISVLGVPGSIAGAGLAARGRPGKRSISLFIALICNLTTLVLLAPSLGAVGAAIATTVGSLVASNLNIVFLNRFAQTRFRDFYAVRVQDVRAGWALLKRLGLGTRDG